jgi:hypothetical protein
MYVNQLDIAKARYEAMSSDQRMELLLKQYPPEMLAGDDSYLHIYEGDVCITIAGNGDLVDVAYNSNDRC